MGMASAGEAWQVDGESDIRIVDDRVMGGVSLSRIEDADEGFVYTGTLSRDQGGGFASMRITDRGMNVAGHEGIELVVKGDGRHYQLTAQRSDVRLRAGSYRTTFEAPDTWTTLRLPFAAFGAMQMGQDVVGAPSLDGDLTAIDSLGVLLTDGPEGVFRLEVRSMRPYGEARERTGDPRAVVARLTQAIETGVPRYNAGDEAGCREAYEAVLRDLVESPELTEGERALARRAIDQAAPLPNDRAAWRLRYGIDALLAGLLRGTEASPDPNAP